MSDLGLPPGMYDAWKLAAPPDDGSEPEDLCACGENGKERCDLCRRWVCEKCSFSPCEGVAWCMECNEKERGKCFNCGCSTDGKAQEFRGQWYCLDCWQIADEGLGDLDDFLDFGGRGCEL